MRFFLRRGQRWREELRISNTNVSGATPNSGSEERPIVISSYGEGDLPTIDGADTVTGWTSVGGGVFKTVAKGAVYKVFVDGDDHQTTALLAKTNFVGAWSYAGSFAMWDSMTFEGRTYEAMTDVAPSKQVPPAAWFHIPDLQPEQQISGQVGVARTPGSWYLDSRQGLLFVHLADGGDPARHAMQVSRRRYGLELQGLNHIRIDGLRVIHAGKSGIVASVFASNGGGSYLTNEYNTIQNSVIWNSGDVMIDVLPGTNMAGEGDIYVAASPKPTDLALRGWKIEGNAVGAIDNEGMSSFLRSGISVTGTEAAVVRNNYVASGGAMGISVFTDRGPRCLSPRVEGNLFTNSWGNLRVSGCERPVIDSNTMQYSYGYGIQTGGNTSGATVTHNLIHHISISPKGNAFNGFDCNGGAPGGTLAYNTITAVWAAEATLEKGCDHWNVHHNVFDSSQNAQNGGLTLYLRQEALPGMVFENNLYSVDPSVTRQFNYGAGQKGVSTFHDIAWWLQNVETTARVEPNLFRNRRENDFALRNSWSGAAPEAALPTKPFVANEATAVFRRDVPALVWQPQDKLR